MLMRTMVLTLLLVIAGTASAESAAKPDDPAAAMPADEQERGWSLGVGVGAFSYSPSYGIAGRLGGLGGLLVPSSPAPPGVSFFVERRLAASLWLLFTASAAITTSESGGAEDAGESAGGTVSSSRSWAADLGLGLRYLLVAYAPVQLSAYATLGGAHAENRLSFEDGAELGQYSTSAAAQGGLILDYVFAESMSLRLSTALVDAAWTVTEGEVESSGFSARLGLRPQLALRYAF